MSDFADRLIRWHRHHGRHDLPWQNTTDPYRIWLSEIMLQQTQVDTVIPYYARFLARFPDLATLAAAPVDEVMALWSGLGYYARARNLHACARTVMTEHGGQFPARAEAIAALPGIGRSTAAAIATFAFGQRAAILDGNVKRVLCRAFGVDGFPGSVAVERRLWALADALLPATDVPVYIQAQMDLGATVCTRGKPRCPDCPMQPICVAHATGRTTELPEARPRKRPPVRTTHMAVITDGMHLLLVQRPPKGIWGGLLSLPEFDRDTPPDAWWRAVAADVPAQVTPLDGLRHTFTHYVLDIAPVRFTVDTLDAIPAIEAARVCALDAVDELGLPAPVRRILASA
ncbi:A/G-specific adenine glycosylase [Nitrogeniibacter mangrovi]|uniref:Adenine DNA glycosylase n=1 Tax=Nitrogeniibacter mangrovi TaxID=2016596 RepID=A0A6C1AYL2_9RHOO|nr:A/G-specific adenine glycosylase [Nitrogeniibacter mangrovi]QID16427.1 A/G-specific adenine glycosylase [Nitrogeniibacter mangrovi]